MPHDEPPDSGRRRLRWQFVPEKGPARLLLWRWKATDADGALVMESARAFQFLSECINDARLRGYVEPPAGKPG